MSPQERQRMDYYLRVLTHEAGHGLVHALDGDPIERIVVSRQYPGGVCLAQSKARSTETPEAYAIRQISCLLAGEEAELASGWKDRRIDPTPTADLPRARRIAREAATDAAHADRILRAGRERAQRLVTQHGGAIGEIRNWLARSSTEFCAATEMSGEVVKALVQRSIAERQRTQTSLRNSAPADRERFIGFVPKSMPESQRQRIRQQYLDQHGSKQSSNQEYVRQLIEQGKRIQRQRRGR